MVDSHGAYGALRQVAKSGIWTQMALYRRRSRRFQQVRGAVLVPLMNRLRAYSQDEFGGSYHASIYSR